MTNCRCTLFDIGICISGPGVSVMNCSTERCNTAMVVGLRNDTKFGGIRPASGAQDIGYQTERCNTGILVLNATACLFAGNIITGIAGTADEAPIGTMAWDSGTVTVTTAKPHNLTIGADVPVSIENTPAAWLPGDKTGIKPTPTTPQFGSIISGGGTHRCKVRWNGRNWTCVGV